MYLYIFTYHYKYHYTYHHTYHYTYHKYQVYQGWVTVPAVCSRIHREHILWSQVQGAQRGKGGRFNFLTKPLQSLFFLKPGFHTFEGMLKISVLLVKNSSDNFYQCLFLLFRTGSTWLNPWTISCRRDSRWFFFLWGYFISLSILCILMVTQFKYLVLPLRIVNGTCNWYREVLLW